eukprot:TRINITY_DN16193_c0_g2_i1.p1 TRINITY_DN16193_c0_g2~~TRINITY_DN16193_c0_g2_i1.p1  ORF type:complete len:355 (-),score=48.76 TRINITY_DN16193_c0_g2_i1:126-1190(-)
MPWRGVLLAAALLACGFPPPSASALSLQPRAPAAEHIDGEETQSWKELFGSQPYYIGATKSFANGDKHAFGQRVTVLGRPSCKNNLPSYNCKKRLVVSFPGNTLTSALLQSELSKDPPVHNSASLLEVGSSTLLSSVEKVQRAASNTEMVASDGKRGNGWSQRLGFSPFYIGKTKSFDNGDVQSYGQRVTVLGRPSCKNNVASYHCEKRLIVSFPGNALTSCLLEDELSKLKPGKALKGVQDRDRADRKRSTMNLLEVSERPGKRVSAWKVRLGARPYYIGKTKDFTNGDKHVFGQRVTVLGRPSCKNNAASFNCDHRLVVRFPGNTLTSALLEQDLSKHKPKKSESKPAKAKA